MAIYRSDQAQLTFATEAAPGGAPERQSAQNTVVGSGSGDTHGLLYGAHTAGATYITLDTITGTWENGDYIQLNYDDFATKNSEVRRIEFAEEKDSDNRQILRLDAPLGFNHADNSKVTQITGITTDETEGLVITNIPGIYEIVDLPDPQMTLTPAYFLGTDSKRNYNRAYSGQQTYQGSLPNMVLLNATPLRFPFGKIVSWPGTYPGAATPGAAPDFGAGASTNVYLDPTQNGSAQPVRGGLLLGERFKGDMLVPFDNSQNTIVNNCYIVFTGSTTAKRLNIGTGVARGTATCEIRRHIGTNAAGGSGTLKLDKPLQYDHADNEYFYVILDTAAGAGGAVVTTETGIQAIPFNHIISETVDLDTITWHAHMKSSNETSTHNFDRRYFGGKVGNATISAEEGGVVMMSWEDVAFMGMMHNQTGTNPLHSNAAIPMAGGMHAIEAADISQPTTEPYYFSQGEVTFAGMTIARLRSFNISVSNSLEPRYYISKRVSERKGPTEIREQRREYSMSATLALPDTAVATSTDWTSSDPAATALFQELLFEGDYGSGKTGFVINLTFTRATGDTITIKIPNNGTAAAGNNAQGAVIRTAAHNITTDGPLQVEADIMFRNLQIEIADKQYYYP